MDKLKAFSLDQALRSLLEVLASNKSIVVSVVGMVLIGYTMFNVVTNLDTEKDNAYYQELQDGVVITRFDEDVVDQIRELDDYQESINSQFDINRNNPFVDN